MSSAPNLRRKNASASSGLPACQDPTTRSPSGVRTYTVPSASTRPHGSLAVLTANLLLAPIPALRDQVFVMCTLSMTTFSFGWPSPVPLAVPALATFWMIPSPLTILPNGV